MKVWEMIKALQEDPLLVGVRDDGVVVRVRVDGFHYDYWVYGHHFTQLFSLSSSNIEREWTTRKNEQV